MPQNVEMDDLRMNQVTQFATSLGETTYLLHARLHLGGGIGGRQNTIVISVLGVETEGGEGGVGG